MLRRLASSAALVATAVMVLAGCTPPEPTETDSELLTQATSTLDRFYQVVDEQFESGAASPEAFSDVAAPELAEAYSSEVQAQISEGVSSRGVPEVTDVELAEGGGGDLIVHFCTDARDVQTTTPTGPIAGQTVAWTASFDRTSGASLVVSALEIRGDESLCGR